MLVICGLCPSPAFLPLQEPSNAEDVVRPELEPIVWTRRDLSCLCRFAWGVTGRRLCNVELQVDAGVLHFPTFVPGAICCDIGRRPFQMSGRQGMRERCTGGQCAPRYRDWARELFTAIEWRPLAIEATQCVVVEAQGVGVRHHAHAVVGLQSLQLMWRSVFPVVRLDM